MARDYGPYRDLLGLLFLLWPSDAIWRHRSGSALVQAMACCLTAPNHCLNHCWLLISQVLWHSPESNFTVNAQVWLLVYIISLRIILLKLLPHLPGANELNHSLNHQWRFNQNTVRKINFKMFYAKWWPFHLGLSVLTHRWWDNAPWSDIKTWLRNRLINFLLPQCSVINPLHAKFFRRSIKMYLPFISFFDNDMTQVVEILPYVRQGPTCST